MSSREELEALKAQMASIRAEMTTKAKAALEEQAKAIFAKYPELETFGWTQYTPYFNDGDPCVFGAIVDYPYINDDDSGFARADGKRWEERAMWDVAEFLRVLDNDTFRDMFGDHALVTVSRDGVTVKEYSHD